MKTTVIAGEPSWTIRSSQVQASVTPRGGHTAPVVFKLGQKKFAPFSIAPWSVIHDKKLPPIIQFLRGDFFCMPFGTSPEPFHGERHPVHGDPPNLKWSLVSAKQERSGATLHARLRTRTRRGQVDKHLQLIDGHPAVYCRHVISGMKGPMTIGHHAILDFTDRPAVISTSPFDFGQVYPGRFDDPEAGAYSSLKSDAEFTSLEHVPLANGGETDASKYPNRAGYEDALMMQSKPVRGLGWTAATFPGEGVVWFGLKDKAVLPGTLLWFSNGGRHMPPWSGVHRNRCGLEEVCAYYDKGLALSTGDNPHRRRGFKTSVDLDPTEPLVVNYIFGAAAVPSGFDRVEKIEPDGKGIRLTASSGKSVRANVRSDFLWEKEIHE